MGGRVPRARRARRQAARAQARFSRDGRKTAKRKALFEREFHTLAQLSHPRVIEVYDYGVDELGAVLHDGAARRRRPARARAAAVARGVRADLLDVCSSLALLHSRRLVHRDISPRNVRCTRDGRAKLIDFGAMVPMGVEREVVGTPRVRARPRRCTCSALDARTDLFSLGAHAVLRADRPPRYPRARLASCATCGARRRTAVRASRPRFRRRSTRWCCRCSASIRALRPRSAFEVMQRLSAIAGLGEDERVEVSRAYLATPTLVGREEALRRSVGACSRSCAARAAPCCS